ncbi:MAG: type 2 lanthipeptide synthetase LanM, partial [Acidobacteriota bacterium]
MELSGAAGHDGREGDGREVSGAPGISAGGLSALVWQARTLDEVLRSAQHAGFEQPEGEAEPELVRRWRAAYSGNDLAAFRRRLAWDGLELADVAAAARAVRVDRPEETEDLPAWVRGLTAALSRGRQEGPELTRRGLPAPLAEGWHEGPPPFAELWAPFVYLAREDVERRMGGDTRPLECGAFAALERYLLLQLASVAELVLYEEFEAARAAHGPGSGAHGREVYAVFLADMFEGGLGRVLARRAALARRVWRLLSTWVTTTAELLERLRRDLPAITETLCDGVPPGGVVEIAPGLSDRHEGGRQVSVLRFRSGSAVVYKPRDVSIEVAFQELLRWLSEAGLQDVPPPLRMLGCEGYGWAELVERGSLPSQEALRRYHRRAGGLVCLAHLLGAADLHMDNVIATVDGPVLVDAEALLQPPGLARLLDEGSAREGVGQPEKEVCIATGLVTFPVLDPYGDPYEIGGLTGSGGYLTDPAHRVWRSVNSDTMRWDRVEARAPGMANLPLLEGEECLPFQFADALCEGFEAAYHFLTGRRAALLAEGGQLTGFAHVASRVVLRPSALYVAVLRRLATPRFQSEGIDAGFLIDSLNTVFKSATSRPVLWPLVAGERTTLEGLDVPRFTVRTDSTDVTGPDGSTATGGLRRTAFAAMVDRIRGLGETDLVRQVEVLRRSLGAAALRHALARSEPPAAAPSVPGAALGPPMRAPESVLLEWAAEAGERIASGLAEALSVSEAEPGLRPFY